MTKLLIKKGAFEGESWHLNGDKLCTGFYKVKELPLSELRSLHKRQTPNNRYAVEFRFNNGITFIASMDALLYEEVNEVYKSCQSNLSENGSEASKSLQHQAWINGQVIAHRSIENMLYLFGFCILAAIFSYAIQTADPHRKDIRAQQARCIERINIVTGYDKSALLSDGQQITYRNDDGDSLLLRCDANKVQFFAPHTQQWINLIP